MQMNDGSGDEGKERLRKMIADMNAAHSETPDEELTPDQLQARKISAQGTAMGMAGAMGTTSPVAGASTAEMAALNKLKGAFTEEAPQLGQGIAQEGDAASKAMTQQNMNQAPTNDSGFQMADTDKWKQLMEQLGK